MINIFVNKAFIFRKQDVSISRLNAHPTHKMHGLTYNTSDNSISNYSNINDAEPGIFDANPTLIEDENQIVTVYWENLTYTGKYDFIALYKFSTGCIHVMNDRLLT